MSSIPNLVRGVLPPKDILVYFPTYNTSPKMVPFVKTVLVQSVF